MGSLQAMPVKLRPKGCGFGLNPGGNGLAGGGFGFGASPADARPRVSTDGGGINGTFGTIPNGTMTVGYPGRAASAEPFAPGNSSASRLFAFITSSMPCVPPRRMSFARSDS